MKLRDVFKKVSAGWDRVCDGLDGLCKATIDGLAMHGRATAGLPPFDIPQPEPEQAKPAAPAPEKKPQQPSGPG